MKSNTPSPIATRRHNRGYSQSSLGRIVGMDRTNLSAIENGRWVPGLQICANLAAALNCTIDDIASDLGIAPALEKAS